MRKQIYEVDNEGFIVDRYVGVFKNGVLIEPNDKDFIITPLPQPNFYKPKWNGTEWAEGATQQEIDDMTKGDDLPKVPTDKERIQSLEDTVLLLMMEGL